MKICVLELVIPFVASLVCIMELPILVWPGKAHINDGKRKDSFKGNALVASQIEFLVK